MPRWSHSEGHFLLPLRDQGCLPPPYPHILQERLAKLAGGVAVIRVGAATETEMKEAKLRMEDALNATRAAAEEGIIAGGGSAYIHAAKEVEKLAESLEGDEKTGAKIVLKALESPLYHIVANAGLEGSVIINKVRESEAIFKIFFHQLG